MKRTPAGTTARKPFTFWIRELPGVGLTIQRRQWVAHVLEPYPMAPGRLRERRVNVGGTADGEPDPALVALLAHQLFTAEHDACHVCASQQKARRESHEAHLPPDMPDLPAKAAPLPAPNVTLPLPTAPARLEAAGPPRDVAVTDEQSDIQTSKHSDARARRVKPKGQQKRVPSKLAAKNVRQPPPAPTTTPPHTPEGLQEATRATEGDGPTSPVLSCPPGDPACSLGVMGGVCAIPAPLFVPAASGPPQKQVARYCLVDANNLVPSHVPWKQFQPHPRYPEGVQERRYDRDKAEQLKVIGVAQQLNPELVFTPAVDAIQGPPVITEDGLVLGGNGRSMALQLHYLASKDAEAKARQYLLQNAAQFGFSDADIKRVQRPVLVRVVKVPDTQPKTLATLVRRYNESASQGMDARAAAAGEARRMDDASMAILGDTMPEDATLTEYLASRVSLPFVDSLRGAGILNQRNASAMLTTDGLLNDDGRQMVERILTAALIPDPNLLEDVGPQLRGTLARSAPYILAVAAAAEPDWDLRPAIQAAARDLVRARAQGVTAVDDYLNQGALLMEVNKAVDGVPMGVELLRMLWDLGGKPLVFSRVMRGYLASARQNPRGQEVLFATERLSPDHAIAAAATSATRLHWAAHA